MTPLSQKGDDALGQGIRTIGWIHGIHVIACACCNTHDAATELVEVRCALPLLEQGRRHEEVVGSSMLTDYSEGCHCRDLHNTQQLEEEHVGEGHEQEREASDPEHCVPYPF